MVNVTPHVTPLVPSNEPCSAGAPDFDQELCALVADTAPALFAVCAVDGIGTGMTDGWAVAWGLAWQDGPTYVVPAATAGAVAAPHPQVMVLTSPERALWWFGRSVGADTGAGTDGDVGAGGDGGTDLDTAVRLVWLGRAGASLEAPGAWARSAA